MEKTKKETIKKTIEAFFEKMDLKDCLEKIEIKENLVSFQLQTDDPEILIGKKGQTLFAVQHLLSKILNHKTKERLILDFDVNQYKKKKLKYLKELAQNTADQVSLTKKEKALPPMSSFERRIVHLALSKREDVQTESQGQEPERRVIIKPR